jgi:hypothetical protein
MKSRLHLHSHTGPQTRAYIVAEPAALKALAQAADRAAKSVIGMETVKFYSSDGHEYELFIACDVSEDEWQTMPGPYEKTSQPDELAVVKLYDEIKKPA